MLIQEADLTPQAMEVSTPRFRRDVSARKTSGESEREEKGRRREREGGRSHKISTIYRTYDVTPIEYILVKVDNRRLEQQGAFGKSLLIYFYAFVTVGKPIIGCFK